MAPPPPPPRAGAASARYEGVNRPDLLPPDFAAVIDVAGFLTPSEEKRIAAEVAALEADTGFKLRVLAQNYPETPGAGVRVFGGSSECVRVRGREWEGGGRHGGVGWGPI